MKISNPFRPQRPPIQITPDEDRLLAKIHREWIDKLQALPEKQRSAVIQTTAHGMFDADPYTRSLAEQLQAVASANSRITAAQQEIAQIEAMDLAAHRPGRPGFRGEMLARKAELEQKVLAEIAHVTSIAQGDHARARQEAIEHFRKADAEEAKNKAINEAADRLIVEAEQREIDKRAVAIANSKRLAQGKDPLPSAPGGDE